MNLSQFIESGNFSDIKKGATPDENEKNNSECLPYYG